MKKFTEPQIDILRLEPVDIMFSSTELIGWAGLDENGNEIENE